MEDQNYKLDAFSIKPLYRQLREIVEGEIDAGLLKPGDKIPSEAELSQKYEVSRITVRAALNELSEEGILVKIQGKGTFVTHMKEKKIITFGEISFTKACARSNMKPGRKLVSMDVEDANSDDLRELALEEGEKVVSIKRKLLADGTPLVLVHDRVPYRKYEKLLNMDIEGSSLNQLMIGITGGTMSSLYRTIEATGATAQDAKLLGINVGSPLLLLRDIMGDGEGCPIRRTREVLAGDRVRVEQ